MARKLTLGRPVTDEFLCQIAYVMGAESAANAALLERDRRRAAGEAACIFWDRDSGVLRVGPGPDNVDD